MHALRFVPLLKQNLVFLHAQFTTTHGDEVQLLFGQSLLPRLNSPVIALTMSEFWQSVGGRLSVPWLS
jgi:hypothetical protein